jgi:hypothetical protein
MSFSEVRMKNKGKRGSHVGIVLSFVIFITFIVFLYVILQPSINTGTKKNFALNIEREIKQIASEDLTSVSVRITTPNPSSCVQLSGFLTGAGVGNTIKVVSENSESLDISVDGNDLSVERDSNLFFRVNEAQEFGAAGSGALGSCQSLVEGSGYDIGLIKTNSYVFETKVLELIGTYSADYSGLKSTLNVAPGNEFGFSFVYNNETEVSTSESNVPLDVYVREVPVQYVGSGGAVESGSLIIRVW